MILIGNLWILMRCDVVFWGGSVCVCVGWLCGWCLVVVVVVIGDDW